MSERHKRESAWRYLDNKKPRSKHALARDLAAKAKRDKRKGKSR